MNISAEKIEQFQKEILEWYKLHKRDLPWRKTKDPYAILVSEIMLQQTQVSRVIPKYEAWMKVFPTVEKLAKAKSSEVLRYWSGLGYNRRALYLQKAAKVLCHPELDSRSPWDSIASLQNDTKAMIAELKKLPGIGEYTAAAVACFAFDAQIPVIDTNIRKVIVLLLSNRLQLPLKNQESSFDPELSTEGRIKNQGEILNSYFIIHDSMQQKQLSPKELEKVAQALLPVGMAYEWNQALMDYASAMLKSEKIPIAKQSRFKDSNRYFRGQIIKQLVSHQRLAIEQLERFFVSQQTPIEQIRLEKIIKGLVRDELIQIRKNRISLR